jgi:hypothetical protein
LGRIAFKGEARRPLPSQASITTHQSADLLDHPLLRSDQM